MSGASFEDTIFIVNMRIKMIRDILRLNPPTELFLEKCLDDLDFINWVLDFLAGTLTENGETSNKSNEFNYASDTEWQFSQLLTEFTLESSPFSSKSFPEIRGKIVILRENSEERRKTLEESDLPVEIAKAEPVVSQAELNGLLGGN